ncbi:MAG: FxsA family protein [Rhodospirillales bacterium]|nr:FxsA family protein [Rhodospirillales bacterium]
MLILVAMIAVPIIEIAVFIEAGDALGLWPTIGVVILTAIIGTALLRHQGLATLGRVRESMGAGRLPVAELFDGMCLLVAGALLLTPGFVTDGVGLLLFMPPFRLILRALMARRLKAHGDFQMHTQNHPQGFDATIIEGEFQEVHNEEGDPDPGRPLPPPDRS